IDSLVRTAFRRSMVANLAAALLFTPYLELTGGRPTAIRGAWWHDPLLFITYAVVLGTISWRLAQRELRAIEAGPTTDQVLRLPVRAARLAMMAWLAAAVASAAV